MKYYIAKEIKSTFEDAIENITAELLKEGFGVLTRINIHEKFKEKLDVDFRKYAILGACNPKFAHTALQHEDKIGTMLPCNVVVQEKENGLTEVAAVDPIASMQAVENTHLASIADEVKNKLGNAVNRL